MNMTCKFIATFFEYLHAPGQLYIGRHLLLGEQCSHSKAKLLLIWNDFPRSNRCDLIFCCIFCRQSAKPHQEKQTASSASIGRRFLAAIFSFTFAFCFVGACNEFSIRRITRRTKTKSKNGSCWLNVMGNSSIHSESIVIRFRDKMRLSDPCTMEIFQSYLAHILQCSAFCVSIHFHLCRMSFNTWTLFFIIDWISNAFGLHCCIFRHSAQHFCKYTFCLFVGWAI